MNAINLCHFQIMRPVRLHCPQSVWHCPTKNCLISKSQARMIPRIWCKNVKNCYSITIQHRNHQRVKLKMHATCCSECANLDSQILNDISSMCIRNFYKMLDFCRQPHSINCFHVHRAFVTMITESKQFWMFNGQKIFLIYKIVFKILFIFCLEIIFWKVYRTLGVRHLLRWWHKKSINSP